jgi:hypothetical protein
MKERIPLGSFLLVIIALISIGREPSATGQANMGKSCDDRLIAVLNPAISSKMVERVPLGPRIDTLEGKTIYMVDLQWGGPEAAYSVYEEMQGWFSRKMPSVKTEIRRSSGGPFGDDPGLRKEIAEKKVDGVIIGIGG